MFHKKSETKQTADKYCPHTGIDEGSFLFAFLTSHLLKMDWNSPIVCQVMSWDSAAYIKTLTGFHVYSKRLTLVNFCTLSIAYCSKLVIQVSFKSFWICFADFHITSNFARFYPSYQTSKPINNLAEAIFWAIFPVLITSATDPRVKRWDGKPTSPNLSARLARWGKGLALSPHRLLGKLDEDKWKLKVFN